VFARLSAGVAGLDHGEFIEGHCLDQATSARVPKNMIGKRLSARQAKLLLDSLESERGDKKETKKSSPRKSRMVVARRKGFEPLTPRFEVWCSIQLSYRRPRQR
jgi:hypothetical protein